MSEEEIKRNLDLIETLKEIIWERIEARQKRINEKLKGDGKHE